MSTFLSGQLPSPQQMVIFMLSHLSFSRKNLRQSIFDCIIGFPHQKSPLWSIFSIPLGPCPKNDTTTNKPLHIQPQHQTKTPRTKRPQPTNHPEVQRGLIHLLVHQHQQPFRHPAEERDVLLVQPHVEEALLADDVLHPAVEIRGKIPGGQPDQQLGTPGDGGKWHFPQRWMVCRTRKSWWSENLRGGDER